MMVTFQLCQKQSIPYFRHGLKSTMSWFIVWWARIQEPVMAALILTIEVFGGRI